MPVWPPSARSSSLGKRWSVAEAIFAGIIFAAPVAPAQAQADGENVMPEEQQPSAVEQATHAKNWKPAQANPSKKWPRAAAVPGDLRSAAQAFAASAKAPGLESLLERLYVEGERNATLNFQRIGLTALVGGQLDVAEKAFDAAVARIEMVYADNPEAQKAKSLWSAEKVKDFKGEPYERAMAYYYRGLVYAAKSDFQNARAMFKQADYQDTVAESEQYAGDFALMPYMAGWASYCDGNMDMARDFLVQAAKADSRYSDVAIDRPLLVLYETGRAPFKFGGGKYGEQLKWAPRNNPASELKSVCFSANEASCITAVALAADLGFQATTRGGRPVDGILGGKASFKEGAHTTARVANAFGQVGVVSGTRRGENLGLLAFVVSIAADVVASQTQAQADIREWEQLPNHIWLATSNRKAPQQTASARLDVAGSPMNNQVKRLVDTPSCQLYWGRTLDLNAIASEMGPIELGQHARDPVFRREITEMFGS